jgi:hypothetical protein
MKQSDQGGLPSLVIALAAAIAPAMVKALIARHSRARSKTEDDVMCRNHSHVQGRIFSLKEADDVTEVRMLVTQPLTVEGLNGTRLTLPQYCVLSVRVPQRAQSAVSQLHEMAAQDDLALPREDPPSLSGLTTQPK